MSDIRVRRSGLITFAIRLGSTLTGLAFIVLVTSNLSQSDFGLWQLISRVIGYVIFVTNILNFWTLRYRARGATIGKTVLFGSANFSLVLSVAYIFLSFGVAGSVSGGFGSNIYYFLISTPQVPLYIFSGVMESILWGSAPARASFGFGVFEISKVIIGGVAVAIFHLSLTGAIIAIIGAQLIQIVTILIMTPNEYKDKISVPIISKMVKTGWLALMNQLYPLVVNFDFLLVAVITGSTIPLALYGAAFSYGTIVTYSGWIAYGLYAGILGGVDPKKSTNQVFELQYLFMIPMVIGEIVLSYRLLHLFKAVYTEAVPILLILSIASAFCAMSQTFDNVITAIDTTDATENTAFSFYMKSKLFLIAKINLILSVAYLASVSISSEILNSGPATILGFQRYTFIGIIWAVAALGMWAIGFAVKLKYVRKITHLSIPRRTGIAYLLGAVGYTVALYLMSQIIGIQGGEVIQALKILLIGAVALAVYGGIVLALSDRMRSLTKYALTTLTK
ncbi:MAG: hypothetical protein ABSE82_10810 [Nitrososphaerales archaeon]